MDDRAQLAVQLGRVPRGSWRVVARCTFGAPTVIATAPLLDGGEPFPTLFYLTCPHLTEVLSLAESSGALQAWRGLLDADETFAERMRAADGAYRTARAAEAGGDDPCASVGIAGQADPLATKCLHAHVAAALAGIDDPVGLGTLSRLGRECDDARCCAAEELAGA